MADKIYVVLDHNQEKIRAASLETLAAGQQMADLTGKEVHAVLLGTDLDPLVQQVSGFQLASVICVDNEALAEYDPDFYTAALKAVYDSGQPQVALFAHTYQNIDLLPKLAAALRKALVTECVSFRKDDSGRLVFARPMFRSKLNAEVSVQSDYPWLISIQAGAFSADDVKKGSAPAVKQAVDLTSVQSHRRTVETVPAAKGKVDLSRAEVIIGVGRGIRKPENLQIVRELAECLRAEIGASRPVVDNEWLERERQIGSSGQTVTPKLYIACGISGAIQHLVGMKNSGCIVAINTDSNAPIFNVATYGIVGDVTEVVPALTKKIRELQG
ncbi:MAG TPA: electron transfer flavoprotein subunit alpha/FixB family protein [Acidobacteriota bacterium]|nr:electron transfer flavoprotein subunit alpha/FixB family protein [Acidobacteriota bacterium]